MAFITKQEMADFWQVGIIEDSDFGELAELSRKKKLKRGETGFSKPMMRNFAVNEHTCSPQVKELILSYFQAKLLKLKKEVDKVFK